MESEQPHFMKSTMNYGLITGLALIVYSLILYGAGLYLNQYLSNISIVILALSIYLTTKHFRDKKLNGYISYSRALGVGTMTGVFAGVLLSFFVFLYLKYYDASIIDKQLELVQQQMLEKGMAEDQVEQATALSKKLATPGVMFFLSIFSFALYGFIISLITSAILKKNQDPFASQMEGIDNI